MKKLIILLLILHCVIGLIGCSHKEPSVVINTYYAASDADVEQENTNLTEEQRKWSKMWELWVEGQVDSPYAELMTYQSEINNGGHGQYFTNVENTGDLQKEIMALETVLPSKLKGNLKRAYEAYVILENEGENEQAEKDLSQCDKVFYENEDEITRILEEYADKVKL